MSAGTDAGLQRIGLGGGCHWCTEAVFQSLAGVEKVEQGWLAPRDAPDAFSEGVVVRFDPKRIDVATLVAVHLHSHSCTSDHALRARYRSAIYVFSARQAAAASAAVGALAPDFDAPILTCVMNFGAFRLNDERYLDYYRQDPQRPFCERFIAPKLDDLRRRFGSHVA